MMTLGDGLTTNSNCHRDDLSKLRQTGWIAPAGHNPEHQRLDRSWVRGAGSRTAPIDCAERGFGGRWGPNRHDRTRTEGFSASEPYGGGVRIRMGSTMTAIRSRLGYVPCMEATESRAPKGGLTINCPAMARGRSGGGTKRCGSGNGRAGMASAGGLRRISSTRLIG
jgi:hypothetical protein